MGGDVGGVGCGILRTCSDGASGLAGSNMAKPLVGIIMGSTSDWETMQHAAAQLEALGVPY